MSLIRTDVHRPSVIIPEDYEYVAQECRQADDLGGIFFIQQERDHIRAHMARTGGTYSHHEHGGNCMVCGNANAIYTFLFYHAKTNTYVRLGSECAEKMEFAFDAGKANAFRTACKAALELRAGKRKAQAVLDNAGMAAAWDIYTATDRESHYEENTIADMVGKLIHYGSLSEKQLSFMRSLLNRIPRRGQIEAERAAAHAAAASVPEGRIVVEGTVLTTKRIDQFCGVYKILVQATTGYKVWGSLPASLRGVQRGATVRFRATVSKSKDDDKFGFFSRPTNAEVLPEPTDNSEPCDHTPDRGANYQEVSNA